MSKHRNNRTLLPLYQPSAPPPQTKSFQSPSRSQSFQSVARTRSFESITSSSRKEHLLHLPTFTPPHKKKNPNSLTNTCCLDSLTKPAAAIMAGPQQEQLPDEAPFPTFFLPNFLGILFAYGLESLQLEKLLQNRLSEAHPYALLGLGVFCIANANSYLAGSVVLARLQYGVKLPNLYAKEGDKNAVAFNCVQRGHQNFVENYAQLVLSVLFVATIRPNTAGVMLMIVAIARVFYGKTYRTNIPARIGPLLIAMFTMTIGIGYGFLVGLTAFGIHMIDL